MKEQTAMPWIKPTLIILASLLVFLALVTLGASYYCYRRIFYCKKAKPLGADEFDLPEGKEYEPYHEQIREWMRSARNTPYERVSIQSHDGLTLYGKYYEYTPNAPVEILFHGYRGTAERDLSGGIERCFALGRSVLLVDQRGCSDSEGKATTFGIQERKDCVRWAEYASERFGADSEILLGGISMGAMTVLSAIDGSLCSA